MSERPMRVFENSFNPFARKVRMVLEHKGLAFESVDGLHESGREALAAVNPHREVPVLADGFHRWFLEEIEQGHTLWPGTVACESLPISP